MSVSRFTRRAVLTAGSAWALMACAPQQNSQDDEAAGSSHKSSSAPPPSAQSTGTPPSQNDALDHSSADSLYVLVNKHHPLEPLEWAPDDLVDFRGVQLRYDAAQAAEKMLAAAAEQGLNIQMLSGYRSHEYQISTYQNWVNTYGQEQADTASARPGFSEHQTGLAFDIGSGSGCDLQPCFAETPEARWMAEHCHSYGFVLRFPYWQHETTGYYFESWHFRYVGSEQAEKYAQSESKNLEEFWGFEPAPSYRD